MLKRIVRSLVLALIIFILHINVFASDSPVSITISGKTQASPGETVVITIDTKIEAGTDIQGIQIDFGYSNNFPKLDSSDLSIIKNTTGWTNVGIKRKNILAVGSINADESEIIGTITVKVPYDAKKGEKYTLKVIEAIGASENKEVTASINADTWTIVVDDNAKSDISNIKSFSENTGKESIVQKTNLLLINPFKDVKETDWFYDAVHFAYSKGITSGVSENSFAPNDRVTRGQFITMLCRAYGIEEMKGDNFADAGDTWYTGYLAAAKQLGISNGVGDNMFAPEKEITREEMVTLIYNYLKSVQEIEEIDSETEFADNSSMSDWAKQGIAFANRMGYVNGKGNNLFDPKGDATRAELAQIFYNIFSE